MKKFKRTLALILSTCLLFGSVSVVTAAEYTDVSPESSYSSAVSLLSALGIIKGYEDGSFGPDRDVTRAEFTVMLMRAMGYSNLGSNDPSGLPFKDLESVKDWAVSDIRTAYDLGIINGVSDIAFEPNSNVTYEQALKMIVCSLGYYPMALDSVGGNVNAIWPNGYINVATQLNLQNGIAGSGPINSKRWEIAVMLYNALTTDMMVKSISIDGNERYQIKEGETLLATNLKVFEGLGELLADDASSIEPSGRLAQKGEVLIYSNATRTTDSYIKGETSSQNIIGHSIKYYYTEDSAGNRRLLYMESRTKSSSTLTISAEDIARVSGSFANGVSIDYWETDNARKTQTASLAKNPIVTVNGRVVSNNSGTPADLLWPDAGTLVLLSSANNGTYDKVNVTALETYVVNSVNTVEHVIVDKYRTSAQNNSLKIDESDSSVILTLKRADGSPIEFTSLREWDVLTVKRSEAATGRNTMEVIVTTKSVTGKITAIDKVNQTIEVDSKPYKYSSYFTKYAPADYEDLSVGSTTTFYLDDSGRIAAMGKLNTTEGLYGYIARVVLERNKATFAFLPQTGGAVASPVYYAANRVKIDGVSYSNQAKIVEVLLESANNPSINTDRDDQANIVGSQLVRYSLNGAREIESIDTVETSEYSSSNDLAVYQNFSGDANPYTYDENTKEFKSATDGSKFRITTSTQIFLIPNDRSDYEGYSKKMSTYFRDTKRYVVEPYDVSGQMNLAKAVLVYTSTDEDATINNDTAFAIIKSIVSTKNPEGDAAQQVTMHLLGKNQNGQQPVSYYTQSSDTMNGYQEGDVVRFVRTSKGYIKDNSVVATFWVGDDMESFDEQADKLVNQRPVYRVTRGLLYAAQMFDAEQMFELALTDDVDDMESATKVSYNAKKEIAYLKYDASLPAGNRLQVSFGETGIVDLTGLPSYESTKDTATPDAADVFVYSYEGVVKGIYVIIK